jgi:hypothetical protein
MAEGQCPHPRASYGRGIGPEDAADYSPISFDKWDELRGNRLFNVIVAVSHPQCDANHPHDPSWSAGAASIWIAKRCGAPLKIAAKIDAVDRGYFQWREATSAFPMCGRHEIALNAPQKTTASR